MLKNCSYENTDEIKVAKPEATLRKTLNSTTLQVLGKSIDELWRETMSTTKKRNFGVFCSSAQFLFRLLSL